MGRIHLMMAGFLLGAPAGVAAQGHTVRGVVRTTDDGPVAGAEVLLDSPKRSTMTDGAGAFWIDSVPEGTRRLLVRRIGYLLMQPNM